MKKLCLITPVILLIGIVSCRQLSDPSESTGAVLIEQPSSDKGVASRDTNMAISIKVDMDTSTYYFIAWTSDVNHTEEVAGGTRSYQLHSFSAIPTRKMMER